MRRTVMIGATMVAMAALGGCATGPARFPVEATRYHYDPVAARGTVTVEPLIASGPASIEFKTYAAAVEGELLRQGFTLPAAGVPAQYVASVSFTRENRPLPPRRSPVSIGLGAGGYSGGGYRSGGGVGLGGGVSFPLGGAKSRDAIVTELAVRLRRGPDAVWEGQAQSLTDSSATDATTDAIARRLAAALFSGFPGQSGRTIQVK